MYKNQKYWLACSGGVDSVVLAHLLHLKKVDFGILHCNFKLRGKESDEDSYFVTELAKKLNVPIEIRELRVNPTKNTQLSARNKRYNWFNEVINQGSFVLLAHHSDDQEETFWLQLERGAGVAGLAAMTAHHEGFIRPLLKYSKTELLKLAKSNNWKWREDLSNQSIKYKRNLYRINLLPVFRDFLRQEEVISIIEDYQGLFKTLKKLNLPAEKEISISFWEELPILIRHEFLRRKKISIHFEKEVTKLCKGIKGARIKTNNHTVWNNTKTLIFEDFAGVKESEIKIIEISPKEIDFRAKSLYFDKGKIVGEISFRKWKSGDYFQPLGMKGKKTISDFLTDRKVHPAKKRDVQVLEDEEKIIGVVGFTCSELVRIEGNTQAILKVSIK